MLVEDFKTLLLNYYVDKPIPKTVTEYKKDYPKGFSPASVSIKGFKLREILDSLNNVPKAQKLPTTEEELISYAKEWSSSTGVSIPLTHREWASKSVNNGEIPYSTGYLFKHKVSALNIIKAIHNEVNRKTPEKVDFNKVMDKLNLTVLECTGLKVHYRCNCCGSLDTTYRNTLIKAYDRGLIGCLVMCNKSNKAKSIKYYQKFISDNFKVLSVTDQVASIKHLDCGNIIHRGIRYITRDSREYLVCEYCSSGAIKEDGFTSHIEKEIITHLVNTFPDLEYERELLYSTLVPTTRKFRGDLYYPELKLMLEITHRDTKFSDYLSNLSEKLELLNSNGIYAYKVTSIKEAEDIVRSLMKVKER